MGTRATLIKEQDGSTISKDAIILPPHVLGAGLTKESWRILEELQKKAMYAKEIAKTLGIHEQNVYYYLNKLESAGLITLVRSEEKQGAVCKYYAPTASAFVAELESSGRAYTPKGSTAPEISSFFQEYNAGSVFDGSIIVGSPVAHGPFLTAARDGHYAVQLGIFLGSLFSLTNRFVIKLDTEAKAENATQRNLIIFGGPVTNTLCSDVNPYLPIKFTYENGWSIHSPQTNTNYAGELDGIIVKVRNPWDEKKHIVVIAGLKHEGTKACVIALTQHYKKVLDRFEKHKGFYAVVRGFDRDGDGKVDDIELLESFAI